MCGILGNFSHQPDRNLTRRLEAALSSLQHRGPDDQGLDHIDFKNGGRLSLGHKRLSIIDLTQNGHQPMKSEDGRYTMVYNGEIYNYVELRSELVKIGHVFQTETDSEVLLVSWQQWGVECLHRLDGMFAFVMFDRKNETIHCVRDAFGIKPLYYYTTDHQFCFGSEPKAIREIVTDRLFINRDHALKYILYGEHNQESSTFFGGIHKVLPGSYLRVDLGSENITIDEKRWYWPDITEREDVNFEQASDEFRELFLQSVKRQLRSDVPLGAALSGGIDSSSVVCSIRHLEPDFPIHTFSYIAKGSVVSEEKWIDLINNDVNSDAHKTFVTSDDFLNDLDDFLAAQGEPLGGMSFYAEFSVYKLAKEHGMKVMLEGHGADESVCGYDGYPEYRVRSLIERREFLNAIQFLNQWRQWPGRKNSDVKRSLIYGLRTGLNMNPRLINLLKRNLRNQEVDDVLFQGGIKLPKPYRDFEEDSLPGRSLAYRLRHEVCKRRCQHHLQGADRSAMIRSIENRVPFLSAELVSFMLRMPEHFMVSNEGRTKHLFRHAMRGIVPNEILERKDKIGYETPSSLRLPMNNVLKKSLSQSLERIGFLNHEEVFKRMHDGDESSIRMDTEVPWRLFNLLKWADQEDIQSKPA